MAAGRIRNKYLCPDGWVVVCLCILHLYICLGVFFQDKLLPCNHPAPSMGLSDIENQRTLFSTHSSSCNFFLLLSFPKNIRTFKNNSTISTVLKNTLFTHHFVLPKRGSYRVVSFTAEFAPYNNPIHCTKVICESRRNWYTVYLWLFSSAHQICALPCLRHSWGKDVGKGKICNIAILLQNIMHCRRFVTSDRFPYFKGEKGHWRRRYPSE